MRSYRYILELPNACTRIFNLIVKMMPNPMILSGMTNIDEKNLGGLDINTQITHVIHKLLKILFTAPLFEDNFEK